MTKDIHVLIVEDDPYARDLMSLLLARDWRTRLAGEIGNASEVPGFLTQDTQRVDCILLDTEMPGDPDWAFRIVEGVQAHSNPPVILCTGTQVNLEVLKKLVAGRFGGYILKGEILYALASAIALAAAGHWVTTPAVWEVAHANMVKMPEETVVLDGKKPVANFTARESEIVRLGIIFNSTHRDVADELVVSPLWVSEIVSKVYEKLGMREIVNGEMSVEAYFEDELVSARIKEILGRSTRQPQDRLLRKTPWMSTLAFHMLTVPEIKHKP